MVELSAGQQSLFQPVAHKEIARLSNDLEYWIKAAENLTLQNLFEKIVQRGGILGYILRSPARNLLLPLLSAMFNFLKPESLRPQELHLASFITPFYLLEEHDIKLAVTP